ncbi:MAG: beta-galactosidase [Phycisphaerales bacterium]
MPSVSLDSKSFLLQTPRALKRFPIVAASFDAAVIPVESWGENLARLRHAGFNAVVIRVPWSLHEPIAGRFVFDGACDVRGAIERAGAEGLKVLLRIGPCVGGTFAGSGLPGWIADRAGTRLREAAPQFLECVTAFWRALVPRFADLQATRNGNGTPRPVIAVGIEDAWHCHDEEVGSAYFAALVRYAREAGVDVPLFSANSCWYMHEGVNDAWQDPAPNPHRMMEELRAVQPDAPPFSFAPRMPAAELAVDLAYRVVARSDFVADVVATAHPGATAAFGSSSCDAVDPFLLRRPLVFASTFAEILASLEWSGEIELGGRRGGIAGCTMSGPRYERLTMTHRINDASRIHRRANGEEIAISAGSASGIDFHASDLGIAGCTLEWCTGSLVALSDDLLVIAGKPRGRLQVKVDGTLASIVVPTEAGTPKIARVRGLRVVAVPFALADGIAIVDGGFEFVDRSGQVVARLTHAGGFKRVAAARNQRTAKPRACRLAAVECIVEDGLVDGSHHRFAPVAAPRSLGAFGVAAAHAYYRARFRHSGSARRQYLMPFQRFVDARIALDGTMAPARRPAKPFLRARQEPFSVARAGMHTLVAEVRNTGLFSAGREPGAQVGVFGSVVEVATLKGVKRSEIAAPHIDPTRAGRHIDGYTEGPDGVKTTFRWSFGPRKSSVIVRLPEQVAFEIQRSGGWFRLNGEVLLLPTAAGNASDLVLPADRLAPMRPKPLAKGEKPPKSKAVKLVPCDNELVLEPGIASPAMREALKKLAFLEVRAEVKAEWAFARVDPPASWASARPAPKRATGSPTWFRTNCVLDAPRSLVLSCTHAGVATVLFNGISVMVTDGAGEIGAKRARGGAVVRTASIPASLVRAGTNEILVFDPDGAMPAIEVR